MQRNFQEDSELIETGMSSLLSMVDQALIGVKLKKGIKTLIGGALIGNNSNEKD